MTQAHTHTGRMDVAGQHLHSAWTDAQGQHIHTAWTDAQGTHDHGFRFEDGGGALSVAASANGASYTTLEMPYAKNADNRPIRTDHQGNHAHNIGIGAAGNHGHNVGIGLEGAHTHAIYIDAIGGVETRPRNIALLVCIKH